MTSSALAMSVGIAATEPTIGGAAGTGDSARVARGFGTFTFGDTSGAARQAAGQSGCAGMTDLDAWTNSDTQRDIGNHQSRRG